METVFDKVAKSYDSTFTESIIGRAQREIVWRHLDKVIADRKDLNILELNCGTGEDAIHFARMGHKVLATDISGAMLDIVNRKIEINRMGDKIETCLLDITKIEKLNLSTKYDLIFSNFGGMNCISKKEIRSLPEVLSNLLNPAGRLIMVIMPVSCIWEKLYFISKFRFSKAFRRNAADGVMVRMNGQDLITYYHNPLSIKKIFGEYFKQVAVKPVGFFIPPSYLENFFASKTKTFKLLSKLESYISNRSILSSFSDHYLIDLIVK